MKRSFNFLGREDLTTIFVATYVQEMSPPQINLRLRGDSQRLAHFPENTIVQIEIRGAIISHVDVDGGLAAVTEVGGVNISDSLIPRELDAAVRVRLVDPESNRILAHTRNVALDGNGKPIGNNTESILNCVLSGTMGSVVWKVEWLSNDQQPKLLLNNMVPGLKESILGGSGFAGLILPEVFRQVLQILLQQMYDADDGSPQGLCAQEWLKLGVKYTKVDPPLDRKLEEIQNWTDKAASAFSLKIKAVESVQKLLT